MKGGECKMAEISLDEYKNLRNDLKIFIMCILSGAVGFSLIPFLPYEIPLFLRVSIAFLLLGIPLLDFKKIVLFGIAGGLGYFIKDYIFWDLFSFKWASAYEINVVYIVLTGLIIGTFLSVVLWNRKAAEIFPLTVAVAFLLGKVGPFTVFMAIREFYDKPIFLLYEVLFGEGAELVFAGLVCGAGMYLYLLSIKKTPSPLRSILLIFAILIFIVFGPIAFKYLVLMQGSPLHVGPKTVVSVGEVVEREGIRIAVTNYTFLQNNTGRILKVGIMIQSPVGALPYHQAKNLNLKLWYRQDEYLGREIIEKTLSQGRLEQIGDTTSYYLFFDSLPERVRTKDFAVVWGNVIWRAK